MQAHTSSWRERAALVFVMSTSHGVRRDSAGKLGERVLREGLVLQIAVLCGGGATGNYRRLQRDALFPRCSLTEKI